MNQDSILQSTKNMLHIPEDLEDWDLAVVNHINVALFFMNQLGVGPVGGFVVTGPNETWTEYFAGQPVIESVKTYVYSKVRLSFDPPTTSHLLDALKASIAELEWRLNAQVDRWVPYEPEADE